MAFEGKPFDLAGLEGLQRKDIHACIAYGPEMARGRFVELALEPHSRLNGRDPRPVEVAAGD